MTLDSRPRLARKARLRRDVRQEERGRHLLLFPERGLSLNGTARDILAQCTGEQTAAQIVDRLVRDCGGADRGRVTRDVLDFLQAMAGRGLLQDARRSAA